MSPLFAPHCSPCSPTFPQPSQEVRRLAAELMGFRRDTRRLLRRLKSCPFSLTIVPLAPLT
ncbi:unnamed protein product, partial [Closterium sp. Naga37s-1]